MSDVAYLTIPGEQVDVVAQSVLGLYAAQAEALGGRALGVLDGEEEVAALERARSDLHVIEDALADLGWPDPPADVPAQLVGPRRVLRDLIRAAVVDAANGVVEAVARYEAGREELPAVSRAVEAVPALFALFAAFEDDEVKG